VRVFVKVFDVYLEDISNRFGKCLITQQENQNIEQISMILFMKLNRIHHRMVSSVVVVVFFNNEVECQRHVLSVRL